MKRFIFVVMGCLLNSVVCAQGTQTIFSQQLMEKIREAVIAASEWPAADVVIEFPKPPADEYAPAAGAIEIVARSTKKKPLGLTPVEVTIKANTKEIKRYMVYPQVDVKASAVMSTRWIKRYEPLTPDNSAVIQSYRSKIPLDALTQTAEVDGRVVKVALPKGKFITQSLLESPPIIKKQDMVDLVIVRSGLKVVVKGVALMDGQRDEVIRVRNVESKRELYGTVKDARTVVVQ